jgi:hypothetical protein
MIPYFDYLDAKNRLKLAKETIELMGGEDECPPMVLGQRDYLELEVEYHQLQSKKFAVLAVLTIFIISSIMVFLILKGYINV